MEIRKATGDEMLALWEYPDPENASPTTKFFYRSISSGNAIFWTIEHHGELIGELYVCLPGQGGLPRPGPRHPSD